MKPLRIILAVSLLLLVASALWAEMPEKPRFYAGTYKMTAKIYLKPEYRMYDSAQVILEEGVHFYPEDAEMHFLLGRTYYETNNYQGMAEQFAAAESLKSKAKWMDELNSMREEKWMEVFNQGAKAFNERDFDSALEKFTTAALINPSKPGAYLNAGYALTLKGEYDQALSYLEKGLKLDPNNPDMLRGCADALFYAGREQEALESYKKILEKQPDNEEVLINVVSIYSTLKDYDQALAYSKKLVAADPNYKDGYFNMGTIYLQSIILTNVALDSLKDENGKFLTDEKSSARAKELTQKKNELLASAQEAFKQVLNIDSSDMEAQVYLAQVYQEQEKFDEALGILEPFVQKDTTNCGALNQLAIIYAKKGMGEQAKAMWQKAQDCYEGQK